MKPKRRKQDGELLSTLLQNDGTFDAENFVDMIENLGDVHEVCQIQQRLRWRAANGFEPLEAREPGKAANNESGDIEAS